MQLENILAKLVSFPSVAGTGNHDIVDWIKSYCEAAGAVVTLLPGPEGDRSNLFVTIGPRDQSGYILSGHMDVVPANEPSWTSDPFTLRHDGARLFGRGASDMKGFLACSLAMLSKFAKCNLKRPIHLAFSYDEEIGCRGVPHMIAQLPMLCAKPLGCIIGEPSNMRAIRAHKGKAAAKLEVLGRSGHSSRPDQGLNAIHAMAELITKVVAYGVVLSKGPFDQNFEPAYSTIQVGVMHGGQAVNIVPDHCAADIEVRAISGVSPVELLEKIKSELSAIEVHGYKTNWTQLSAYPALSLDKNKALVGLLEKITGQETVAAVSYGTEAGLYQQAGMDAIICGPGDISRAHKPDEYIEIGELLACQAMLEALAIHCSN